MQRDLTGMQLGDYRLVRLLGQGSFAEVYLGEHTRLTAKAAIKVLHAHLPTEEIENFRQEAQTIATLKHPHIVRVLDFDVQNSLPFLIMDYYPEGTVRQRHPKGTILSLEMIATYTRQIADALQYAHDQKLVHRDVKPENMLIGQMGEIALSDFGIATIAHDTASLSKQVPIGTIAYMAPEQIQGQARPASDQYALAVIVYEWLCGKRPFNGTYAEVLSKHLFMPPPSLRQQNSNIAPAIEQVVFNALAKDPHQRYANVQEFATALARAIQQTPSKQSSTMSTTNNTALPGEPAQSASPAQLQEEMQPVASPKPVHGAEPDATTMQTAPPLAPDVHSMPTLSTSPPSKILLPLLAGKTPTSRTPYLGIIVGIAIVSLLSGLISFGVQVNNQHMLQVNATSTVVATALAGNKTATAGALSDMATASAQQTAIAVGGPVTATALAHATATAVVQDRSPGYFASSGKMFYDEPLDSAGAGWDNQADSKGDTCQFSHNAYHISETRVGYSFRCVDIGQISGGPELVEVEMMIVKGNCAGLYIRVSKTSNYPFFVCQNGFADIDDHSNTNNNDTILGKAGPGAFRLKAGWNTIGLEVNSNNTIMGYVNGQRIITVQDDGTTNIGEFALAAAGTKTATEVAYRNLRAWLTSSSSMSLS